MAGLVPAIHAAANIYRPVCAVTASMPGKKAGQDGPWIRDAPLDSGKTPYPTALSLARSARLRSFGSSSILRRRIDFGVTSTSSSSSI
jgi:hypothetical protein